MAMASQAPIQAANAVNSLALKRVSMPLGEVPHVHLDARYEKVRVNGTVVSCSLLIARGILSDGHRTILGVNVSLSEAY